MSIKQNLQQLKEELQSYKATLIAVTKTHPPEKIMEVYEAGHKIFGENRVQELVSKFESLPKDIEWHLIGHLQTNKVKFIAPFVSLIHSADSLKLLKEINKEANKNNRILNCLLQIHIAQEETKFGLSFKEAEDLLQSEEIKSLNNICIKGVMGMATLTDKQEQIRNEFRSLSVFFQRLQSLPPTKNVQPDILSMGMSGDYRIALEEGSTMVRVGSALFGNR